MLELEAEAEPVPLLHTAPNERRGQVSLDGGLLPRWSPGGADLMVAEVRTEPEITLGTPRLLFSWESYKYLGWYEYDIAADGERFVMVAGKDEPEPSDSATNMLMLVENWSAE